MRVWSGIFSRLPSKPLEIGEEGLDWQWIVGTHATSAECPGARRFAFVAGFQPAFEPCTVEQPEEQSGWRDWFNFGRDEPEQPQQAPQPTPEPQEEQ
jgi:penicillin-binding protein 1B